MKSGYVMILAIGLGVVGAALNLAYLHKRSQAVEKEDFVGLAKDVSAGQRLSRDDLATVPIPKGQAEQLNAFGFRIEAIETVTNKPVTRPLKKGWLLLEDDLRTPREELSFGEENPPPKEGKRLTWVTLDPRTFVPSLLMSGDWVDFLVARSVVSSPTPAGSAGLGQDEDTYGGLGSRVAGKTEIIGPFEVVRLGNRFGRAEVSQAAKVRQVQENTLGIAVRVNAEGKLDGDAQKLADMLAAEDYRFVGVLLYERSTKEE